MLLDNLNIDLICIISLIVNAVLSLIVLIIKLTPSKKDDACLSTVLEWLTKLFKAGNLGRDDILLILHHAYNLLDTLESDDNKVE